MSQRIRDIDLPVSYRKWPMIGILCGAALVLCLGTVLFGSADSVKNYNRVFYFLAFLGLPAAIFAYLDFRNYIETDGRDLTIDTHGIEQRNLFRRTRIDWPEIARYRLSGADGNRGLTVEAPGDRQIFVDTDTGTGGDAVDTLHAILRRKRPDLAGR